MMPLMVPYFLAIERFPPEILENIVGNETIKSDGRENSQIYLEIENYDLQRSFIHLHSPNDNVMR